MIKKELKITVDGVEYNPSWETSSEAPSDLEMRSDLLYNLGFAREPIDESLVVETEDQSTWIPMRYVGCTRLNVYDGIRDGKIRKEGGYLNFYNMGVSSEIRSYVSDNFDEYATIAGIGIDTTAESSAPTSTATEGVASQSEPSSESANDSVIADSVRELVRDILKENPNYSTNQALFDTVIDRITNNMVGKMDINKKGEVAKLLSAIGNKQELGDKLKELLSNATASASVSKTGSAGHPIPYIPQGGPQGPETPGFSKQEDGTTEIDLSKIAGGDSPANNYDPSNPILSVIGKVYTPQSPKEEVVVSPSVEPSAVETIQPTVKTRKDKGDLEDAAPNPTIVSTQETIDASKLLFEKYADRGLNIIDDAIGNKFIKRYSVMNNNLIKVDVYDEADKDLQNPIESMGIVVDIDGRIYSSDPKFWMQDEVTASTPVDFIKPLKITKDCVQRALSEESVEDDYIANDTGMRLNRILNVRSLQNFINDHDTQVDTMRKIESAFKNKTLKNKLGDGRMAMTSFKDSNNFVLETLVNIPEYNGGPTANKTHVVFTCENGKFTSKTN